MEHVKITLIKSPIGYAKNQKLTVRSLGLRKMNDSVIHVKNDAIMGMANTVRHLVKVEAVEFEERLSENLSSREEEIE
ncbi:MAG TPA: 50S ribosomal protein L30 [Thermotogota bacterium]|jgi:large subunit ribosomal protein L30|nr:50S ribosomal protein L30 [Thermotogota bacterium]NLH20402.1 50S ribosomal protein L30 [Thermotogaceae bacterium]OQC31711.1 MAG: 50S ribosomal protein L30 [Thermotogota bacterium ADurb.Bin062]HNW46169.1 50S ribosomal protein L30 [Thermotogota bacterium]HNY82935.1 50S ribosomal protein L30 [Thermotogota bacterium]